MVNAAGKNLWVAASDGDLERVKQLIDNGATANDRDENSYTPMHAAASYAHIELLEYLVSAGGDINLADEDGDTPLFTVETVRAAQWLVEHGANAAHMNEEGLTAAATLHEDHPEVAAYLRSVTGEAAPDAMDEDDEGAGDISTSSDVPQLAIDRIAGQQTDDLLADARAIMEQAERDGVDPDERLREILQRAVREGFRVGGNIGAGAGGGSDANLESPNAKRSRGE